jgi:hypothetical protein
MPVPVKNFLSGLFSVDVSVLAAGIYVVSVRTAEGLSRSKLVNINQSTSPPAHEGRTVQCDRSKG